MLGTAEDACQYNYCSHHTLQQSSDKPELSGHFHDRKMSLPVAAAIRNQTEGGCDLLGRQSPALTQKHAQKWQSISFESKLKHVSISRLCENNLPCIYAARNQLLSNKSWRNGPLGTS